MKLFIDTDTMVFTKLEGANATTVDPVKETTVVPASQYTSDLAQMFGHAPTADDPNAWWNKAANDDKEVRQQISLQDGQHYDIDGGSVRKIVELTRPDGQSNNQLHVVAQKAGSMRLQIAGKASGDAIGGVAVGIGAKDAKPSVGMMEGPLQSYDYITRPLAVGEYVTLFVRAEGGDKTWLFVVNPQT